jgi:dethiobiotin synthetase
VPQRPHRVVAVVGTGTDIGKTWVAARLLSHLRVAGLQVAARKPAQSFDPGDDPTGLDAAVLGAATGEPVEEVCPPHRWYETAMAPPMAAESLGRPAFSIDELAAELVWPDEVADVGLVETAGGLRSPLAADGDCLDYCAAVAPDLVLLVADAGLGTINAVRLTLDALGSAMPSPGPPSIVVLNRFDATVDLHRRNRQWLQERDERTVVALPGEEAALAALVSD